MTNNVADHHPGNSFTEGNHEGDFGCSVGELRNLMELRSAEAVARLNDSYGGVHNVCKRLKTSPVEGKRRAGTLWGARGWSSRAPVARGGAGSVVPSCRVSCVGPGDAVPCLWVETGGLVGCEGVRGSSPSPAAAPTSPLLGNSHGMWGRGCEGWTAAGGVGVLRVVRASWPKDRQNIPKALMGTGRCPRPHSFRASSI